jgi:thioredoxin
MKELTSLNEFEELLKKGDFILDFYADWCGPCQVLKIILERIENKIPVEIVKVNVDNFPELAQQFNVQAIPHLVFFKEGQPVKTITGLIPEDDLLEIIKEIYP